MRQITPFLFMFLGALFLTAQSIEAFDGNRRGFSLGLGLGYVPAGPYHITGSATAYTHGTSSRLLIGYAPTSRTMVTVSLTRHGAIHRSSWNGSLTWVRVNAMWELALSRYSSEAPHSTLWRSGLGLIDWASWGKVVYDGNKSHDWNIALVGGIGYMFLKGFQVQLDLVAGPGPSEGDSKIKGLIRFELVGMIY